MSDKVTLQVKDMAITVETVVSDIWPVQPGAKAVVHVIITTALGAPLVVKHNGYTVVNQ